jgi:hypothetical protein
MALLKWNRPFYFSTLETRPATGSSIHRLVTVVASTAAEAEELIVQRWFRENKYPAGWSFQCLELSKREYNSLVAMCDEVPA